jgi:hypothetical protein
LRIEESSLYRQPMSDSEWQGTLTALKTEIARLDQKAIERLAGQILGALGWLDPVMKRYCKITCPNCNDPCCLAKNIFYNRADILSLIALGITPPSGQTRTRACAPCRYLTPHGCRLERAVRPYVCVWYLCDTQMDLFRGESALTQRFFIKQMEQLRLARIELESLYEGLSPSHLNFG